MGKPTRWLGLDVGGANLKAATDDGYARKVAFPLWEQPEQLPAAINDLRAGAPAHSGVAVTMTGELADCFATKAEGVAAIVAAVEVAATDVVTRYYSSRSGGAFVGADEAAEDWPSVAAANWHALAKAVALARNAPGLLIDIGSTTTDIIPFGASGPEPSDFSDTERLLSGRLVYLGVGRTPVCALVDTLPYRGEECPVAAELFATTADIAILLGHAEPGDGATSADGRPFTKAASVARLARMICADMTAFDERDAATVAEAVGLAMELRVANAIGKVTGSSASKPPRFVLSGEGSWLAEAALRRIGVTEGVELLTDQLGLEMSVCSPAWAVASLAERGGGYVE